MGAFMLHPVVLEMAVLPQGVSNDSSLCMWSLPVKYKPGNTKKTIS